MTPTIFREYDIRGIFDKELNEQSVKRIGYYLGKIIKQKGGIVAIGYDARLHSPLLCDYLTSGLNYAGCTVLNMGMVATPVNYFVNFNKPKEIDKNVNASIMITGSHNPPEYNGFKITIDKMPFFGDDICKLRDEILKNPNIDIPTDTTSIKIDTKEDYVNYIVNEFKALKGLDKKIVVDGGNGVVGVVLKDIFDKLELNYKGIYLEPDGNFPNHHPDPSVEENLKDIKELIQKESADVGFAYDGDADRVATLTKKHNIKGDEIAVIFAKHMQNPVVIGEVKCSQVMYDEINKIGKAIMYKTGHSNLKVKMKETNASLACEVSGHIFFADRYYGYDDAIYATMRVLELLKDGVDLDKELETLPKLYSTPELKVKTTDEDKFKIINIIKENLQNPPSDFPKIIDIIDVDGVRVKFDDGWALVRASNTTPIIVTRFEAKSLEKAQEYQKAIEKLIKEAKERL